MDSLISISNTILNKKYSKIDGYVEIDMQVLCETRLIIDLLKFFSQSKIIHVIDNSRNLDKPDASGWYPIHYFSGFGNSVVLEHFMKLNNNMYLTANEQYHPLHVAIMNNNPTNCRFFIERMDVVELGVSDNQNWAPIHFSLRNKMTDITDKLILAGVDIECKTTDNWAPIHMALRYDHDAAKLLIENGVDLEMIGPGKWTPIHFAAAYCDPEMIKLIAESNVNIFGQTLEGVTPADLAIRYSTPEIIALLRR